MAGAWCGGRTVQTSSYSQFDALRDGSRVEIRAQRHDDRAELLAAFGRLGEQSRYYRFFAAKRGLSESEIAYFMTVDFSNHVALVAVVETAGSRQIVGAGRYIVSGPGTAEMAFAVDDAHQGLGIASALIRHLAAIARAAGLDALHAEVLAGNAPMLKVFEKSGLEMSTRREEGAVHVALRLH